MKQIQLNGALLQSGFRLDENGFLAKYTEYGRRRRNWKSSPRQRSRQFLKEDCERCGANYSEKILTIHHKIPLRRAIIITPENCQTLCRECHNIVEKEGIKDEHLIEPVIIGIEVQKIKTQRTNKLNSMQQAMRGRKILNNGMYKGLWGEYRLG